MSLHYKAAGLTDIGKVREENQDAFYVDENLGLFVVADGMGGMQEGALAAQYVTEGLLRLLREGLARLKGKGTKTTVSLIKKAVDKLSSSLRERAGEHTGAALVSTLIDGENAYIAHLGDCRAYLIREGNMQKLTRDHNVASLLVDAQQITSEEARRHPMRHRLTAYVGMEGQAIPEVKLINLKSGDRLLLCTDGLTSMIPDDEISIILNEQKSQEEALHILISKTNDAGGYDNITAILIDFKQAEV